MLAITEQEVELILHEMGWEYERRYWKRVQHALLDFSHKEHNALIDDIGKEVESFQDALLRLERALPKREATFVQICCRGWDFRQHDAAAANAIPENELLSRLMDGVVEIGKWLKSSPQRRHRKSGERGLVSAVQLIGDELPAAYEDIFETNFPMTIDGRGVEFVERILQTLDIKTTRGRDYHYFGRLLTPLLVANPFSAMRAALRRRSSDEFENGVAHGWQGGLRWRPVDSFFPIFLF